MAPFAKASEMDVENLRRQQAPFNFDWFKTGVGIAIVVGGFFLTRLINELDDGRRDVQMLQIKLEGMSKDIEWIKQNINNKQQQSQPNGK
jgi:hypothetical protein